MMQSSHPWKVFKCSQTLQLSLLCNFSCISFFVVLEVWWCPDVQVRAMWQHGQLNKLQFISLFMNIERTSLLFWLFDVKYVPNKWTYWKMMIFLSFIVVKCCSNSLQCLRAWECYCWISWSGLECDAYTGNCETRTTAVLVDCQPFHTQLFLQSEWMDTPMCWNMPYTIVLHRLSDWAVIYFSSETNADNPLMWHELLFERNPLTALSAYLLQIIQLHKFHVLYSQFPHFPSKVFALEHWTICSWMCQREDVNSSWNWEVSCHDNLVAKAGNVALSWCRLNVRDTFIVGRFVIVIFACFKKILKADISCKGRREFKKRWGFPLQYIFLPFFAAVASLFM